MIPALRRDQALLDDIHRARTEEPESLHVWWFGQSGFLVCSGGKTLLFDPYLSDSLTAKYAQTDKPHDRMVEQALNPTQLDFVDVVTSTHNHTDHLDAATLTPIFAASPQAKMLIPEANRDFVCERLAVPNNWPIGLDDGGAIEIAGIQFKGFPAAHNEIDRDENGRCKYMGYTARIGNWSVYHSGDTRPIDGLAGRLREESLDIAMLPINGSLEERRVSGNLWGQEAAALAHNAGCRWVIPCHYNMFTFNTESPAAFAEACERREQSYRILQVGERFTLTKAS